MIFWTKFSQKGCFQPKTEKVSSAIEFCIFELVYLLNFSWNWQFWFFGPNFPKKVSPVQNRKSEQRHWILHIRISLFTKFQLKLTILIFWTKFVQKGYFQSKTEKVNITIKFCIFKLVQVPNFSLHWQFWFFWTKFAQKGYPVEHGKIALVRVSMVVTYYIKLFRTGADRHNGILMSLLLLVQKTAISNIL